MIVAAIAAGLFATATSAVAQERRQVMLDKVVAVVGGSSILHSEVTEYADALVAQRRQMGYTSDRDPMNEALEALLEQKLLYNQALIDSVPINSADIASRIETYTRCLSRRLVALPSSRPRSTCPSSPTARCCAHATRSRHMLRLCAWM